MKQNTLRYGLYSFLGIISFFGLMKFFGLEDVSGLRAFNLVIVIYFSNALARRNIKAKVNLNYLENLASVFLSNVVSLALSALGFYLYVKLIDPQFLSHFQGGVLWQANLSLWQAIASIILEGFAGSIIVSYTIMQYWGSVKHDSFKKTKHAH